MKQTLKTLSPLLVVFTVLLSSSFIDAAWTAPSGVPSAANNAPEPLNVSAQNQIKTGDITALNLKAGAQMWSAEYCDENGQNCTDIANVGGPTSLPSCSVGEVLKVGTGGGWGCGTDATGGGSSDIITVITDCDFDTTTSCPAGYTLMERRFHASCGREAQQYELTCHVTGVE